MYIEDGEVGTVAICKKVETVELVLLVSLIALAIKELKYSELLAEESRHQSLKHSMVCLVAQHALHSPVKSYIVCHNCQ